MPSDRPEPATPERSPARHERGLAVAVFLIAFGLYGALGGRYPLRGEVIPMWEVAESLVAGQGLEARTPWNVAPGPDGRVHALLPLLTSLVHVPGAAAQALVARVAPAWAERTLPLATRLGPALLGALTCALFFLLARRVAGRGAAVFCTAVVALGTQVAVYARTPFSEILQTACFTGLALATASALERPGPAGARRVAIWLGLLINAKLIYVLAIPGIAGVLAWRLRRTPRRLLASLAWGALILALFAAPILWYDWVRFGDPLTTGYGPTGRGTMWRGLWGLFLSPGKSVLLYNPPLALALVGGLPALARRQAWLVVALALAVVPIVLFYAQFMYWDGDWAWGPRFLTFAVPAGCVALAPFVEETVRRARRWRAAWIAVFSAAGLGVQALGCLFFWNHWIELALAATGSWLRDPVCPPPLPAEQGCWPDGKVLYGMHWIPSLQPIAGHLWLARHVPFGDPFEAAEDDAPWAWEHAIRIPGRGAYDGVVIDWWPLAWGERPRAAALVLALQLMVLAGGLLVWWRRVAAARV